MAEILVRCIGRVVVADRGSSILRSEQAGLYTVGDLGGPSIYRGGPAERIDRPDKVVAMTYRSVKTILPERLSDATASPTASTTPQRFALEDALPEKIFMVNGALRGDYGQLTSIIPGRTRTA